MMNQRMSALKWMAPALLLWTLFSLMPAFAGDPIKVAASILPQKYFVERIGGDRVDVSVMVLPGANPATYEPKPKQMVDLTESKIYFAIGVPFETVWLKRFADASPKMEVVATQAGIERLSMEPRHHHGKDDHEDPASHSGKDPHIWLSPPLVMLQARHILKALIAADPDGRSTYEVNYRQWMKELVDLDLKIANGFSDNKEGKRFMVYHPAWGYFAAAYGLVQIPVEIEGKSPTPKALQQLIDRARSDGIHVVFVQPQFSTKSAETIAQAIDGRVIPADPLALDWQTNLLHVAEQFRSALK